MTTDAEQVETISTTPEQIAQVFRLWETARRDGEEMVSVEDLSLDEYVAAATETFTDYLKEIQDGV